MATRRQAKKTAAEVEKKTAAVPEKKEEVKETAEKKVEEVKVAAGKKVEEVKVAAKAKAEDAKKAVEKKATRAKRTTTAKKEIKTDIIFQYGEKEVNTRTMVAAVKKEWTKGRHKVSEIKSIELYVKPEDYAVYYVVNGDTTGKIWL